MSMLLGPLLSLWIGVSEPDGVPSRVCRIGREAFR